MTCIIGLKDTENGIVYVGSDSAGTMNEFIITRADEKVFFTNRYLIAITGSFRLGQLLRYKFRPTLPMKGEQEEDMYGFMVTSFVEEAREVLKKGGLAKKKDEVETLDGGGFLIAYKDKLFEIEDDYQVAEHLYDYTAAGAGMYNALGSLHTTDKINSTSAEKITPFKRIHLALEAAEEFNNTVRRPFVIKHTGDEPQPTY